MSSGTLIDIDWADLEYQLRLIWATVHFDNCECEAGNADNCNAQIDKVVQDALAVIRKAMEE